MQTSRATAAMFKRRANARFAGSEFVTRRHNPTYWASFAANPPHPSMQGASTGGAIFAKVRRVFKNKGDTRTCLDAHSELNNRQPRKRLRYKCGRVDPLTLRLQAGRGGAKRETKGKRARSKRDETKFAPGYEKSCPSTHAGRIACVRAGVGALCRSLGASAVLHPACSRPGPRPGSACSLRCAFS